MASLLKREKGQALVELAVLLPILLIILVGVLDLGRVFYAYIAIKNASREGARYGCVHPLPTEAAIKNRVITEASPYVSIAADDVEVDSGVSNPDRIIVSVEYEFETYFIGGLPYIRDWFPASGKIPIRAATSMRLIIP